MAFAAPDEAEAEAKAKAEADDHRQVCARTASNVAAFGGDFDFVAIKIPVQTTVELPLGLAAPQLATQSGPLD